MHKNLRLTTRIKAAHRPDPLRRRAHALRGYVRDAELFQKIRQWPDWPMSVDFAAALHQPIDPITDGKNRQAGTGNRSGSAMHLATTMVMLSLAGRAFAVSAAITSERRRRNRHESEEQSCCGQRTPKSSALSCTFMRLRQKLGAGMILREVKQAIRRPVGSLLYTLRRVRSVHF